MISVTDKGLCKNFISGYCVMDASLAVDIKQDLGRYQYLPSKGGQLAHDRCQDTFPESERKALQGL
jgi:hypothetical protein